MIKFENGYLDYDLQLLECSLNMLDKELAALWSDIHISRDPDADGLLETGDYLMGLGFVAYQKYMREVCIYTKVPFKKAIKMGPKYSDELYLAEVINSSANWWKHEPEWFKDGDKADPRKSTCQPVFETAKTTEYTMSNVLGALCGEGDCLLAKLLPEVVAWRDTVLNYEGPLADGGKGPNFSWLNVLNKILN